MLKMKNRVIQFLVLLMVVGVLLTSYYVYYSYYINFVDPELPFLISRTGSLSVLTLDTLGGTTDLHLGIKLGSAGVFLLVFAIGYSAFVYTIHQSLTSIKWVLGFYTSIVGVGGIILLLALGLDNHAFLYRAGAEIKNFAWSPLFMMLIVLAPYTSLLINNHKPINP